MQTLYELYQNRLDHCSYSLICVYLNGCASLTACEDQFRLAAWSSCPSHVPAA